MIRDITIGQYFAGNSVIHRLDPRVKIIAALLFIAGALCEACINPYIMKIILNKVGNI